MKPCVIIGASPWCTVPTGFSTEGCTVICADGGFETAQKLGIQPDIVIGDFDSASTVPSGDFELITLPVEKDDTDSMAAVKLALERGYREFQILGALGGRFDHSYANLSVLLLIAANGGTGVLLDDNSTITLRRGGDNPLVLKDCVGKTISVFPFGVPTCVVSYEGLYYPLEHGTLSIETSLGTSNHIVETEASIIVEEGVALIVMLNQV